MSEKLIPFDFDEWRKDRTRLRHAQSPGWRPLDSAELGNGIAVMWNDITGVFHYVPGNFHCLLLTTPTRTVQVRLYRYRNYDKAVPGRVSAYCSDFVQLDGAPPDGTKWVGEAFDVEVPA